MDSSHLVDALLSAAQHGQWLLAFVLALVGLTALVRWIAPKVHDGFGALVTSDRGGQLLALFNGGLVALVAALSSGKPVTPQLALGAFIGGVLGGGGYNAVKNILWPSDKNAAAAAPKSTQAGGARLSLLLIIAAVGCAGWQAWKTCELGQLPQVAQAVIPSVVTDLGGVDQTTAVTQVENDAGQLLPGQLSCIVQAIIADVQTKSAQTTAQLSPVAENIVRNGQAFLVKHPATACRGRLPAQLRAQIWQQMAAMQLVAGGIPWCSL